MPRPQKEQELLIRAVDSLTHRAVVLSPDRVILAANRAASRGGESVVGLPCHQALKGLPEPCPRCPVTEALRTGRPARQRGADSGAAPAPGSCLYSLPITEGGKVECLLVLDQDLPAEGLTQETLRRSNAFLKNLILSSPDGVIASDMTGRILIFNDAAIRISGYTMEEALYSLNIRDFYPGDGAREVMKMLREDEHGGPGKLAGMQVEVLTRSGEKIPISLSASIVYEEGREAATIGFFRDLRKTLEMERELLKARMELLQAEKMGALGKLAAGVAHQLNNPLAGILLYARIILEEYDLPPGAAEDLKRVVEDALRGRDIVKRLLEFARPGKGEVEPGDVNQAVDRALSILRNQALFQNIALTLSLAQELPAVPMDAQQMNDVFLNILLNAADAMEGRGGIRVSTSQSGDGRRVLVEISDTGPGIPEEDLERVFEPFYTTKREGKGTGLGLSLAYGVVDSLGGRIWAANAPGGGARFFIELPAATGGDAEHGERRGRP